MAVSTYFRDLDESRTADLFCNQHEDGAIVASANRPTPGSGGNPSKGMRSRSERNKRSRSLSDNTGKLEAIADNLQLLSRLEYK